jgi:hypothetical protein
MRFDFINQHPPREDIVEPSFVFEQISPQVPVGRAGRRPPPRDELLESFHDVGIVDEEFHPHPVVKYDMTHEVDRRM